MAAATTTTMKTSRRLSAVAAAVLVLIAAVCCQCPAAADAPAPAPQGKPPYKVGGEDGWRVPPPENKDKYYSDWASNITFYVGDSLEFVYRNDSVLRVSKAGYYHCNETVGPGDGDAAPQHDGTTVFLLDAPGEAYFASADLQRCGMGERLAVTVLLAAAAGPPAPSPASSSSAPGPPWSWVLSPSSAAAASSPAGRQHSAAAAPVVVASSSAHAVVLVAVLAVAVTAGLV